MRKMMAVTAASIVLFFNPLLATTMEYSALAHRISNETAKTIESKYNMSRAGSGGGMMHGVGYLSLSFQLAAPISVDSARKIIVDTAEIYLNNINSNKALRPYLGEYPFRNIALRFYVKYPEKYSTTETLSSFSICFNERTHHTIVEYSVCGKNGFSKPLLEESYEDAKKLVTQNEAGLKENRAQSISRSSILGISCGPIDQSVTGPMVQREAFTALQKFAEGYATECPMKFINIGASDDCPDTAFALWMADFSQKTVNEGRESALNFLHAFWTEIQKNPKLIAWFEDECKDFPKRYQKPLELQYVMFKIAFWDRDGNRPKAPYLSQIVFYKNKFYYYVADPKTEVLQLLQEETYEQSVSKSKEKMAAEQKKETGTEKVG